MKKWMEKEHSVFVYYDDEDGKIIGQVNKLGTTNSIYISKVYDKIEGHLGMYVDLDYGRKAIETYWEIQSRTLLE